MSKLWAILMILTVYLLGLANGYLIYSDPPLSLEKIYSIIQEKSYFELKSLKLYRELDACQNSLAARGIK